MSPKPLTHEPSFTTPGEPEGFAEFYSHEHEGQVRRAYLLLGGAAAAHDVVAEAFMAVLTRWAAIDEPGPYLNRCVLNGCRDHRRLAPREQLLENPESEAQTVAPNEVDALAEQLLQLPFRQRAAIVLRFYGGYGEQEIAAQLECKPGTVGSLIHRGLHQLRHHLTDTEGDES